MGFQRTGSLGQFFKDWYVVSALSLLAIALGLDYLPVLSPIHRQLVSKFYTSIPFSLLVVLAMAGAYRRSERKGEKLFWAWVGMGFFFDFMSQIGGAVLQDSTSSGAATLVVEILGPAGSLCGLIAAAQDAHAADDGSGQSYLRRNRAIGYLILGFALLLYFVVIPAKVDPGHVPAPISDAWYFLIDAVVLARFAWLFLRCSSPRWKAIYGWCAMGVFAWIAVDTLFLLEDANIREVGYGTWVDFFFYLPYLFAIMAAHSRERAEVAENEQVRPPRLWGAAIPSSAFLILLPAMHIGLVSMLAAPPKVQFFRGILVLILSPILFWLVWKERCVLLEQRTRAEANREQSDRLFENFFERAPDACYMIDLSGRFVSGNRAAEEMIGYAREELIGKLFTTCGLVSSGYVCNALTAMAKNALGCEVECVELALNRKDGSQVPVEVRAFPVNFQGRTCILGIARDITERKRIEEQKRQLQETLQEELEKRSAELRVINARYRQVAEQVPAVTYIVEMGCMGRWHYVSPQLESILGYTPEEWMEDTAFWLDHVHPEDRDRMRAAEDASYRDGGTYSMEYRLQTKSGEYMWVRDEARVFATAEGTLLMHGILIDIHERKLLEEQLQQAQRLEAVGHLAGGIAHDFNNLLNIIMGYSQLLSYRTSPTVVQKGLANIMGAAKQGAALTQQLLAFSRKQVVQPRIIDLNQKVVEVKEMLSRVLGEDIELITHAYEDSALIEADPNQIERMLINLAINAREAMPRGGRLVMEIEAASQEDSKFLPVTGQQKPHVRLSIIDDGVGMDAETVAHIFEPFFTTKQRGHGTGLGLAQVYGIVQQSNGSITVNSAPGKGSEFRVYFPLLSDMSMEQLNSTPALKGTETILLVEDENQLREVASAFLEDYGYKILEAETPAEALAIAKSFDREIHLVVTDVILPGMNGKQLADALVSSRPHLKVAFVSGYTTEKVAGAGVQHAQVKFLPKPYTKEELGALVRESLDEAEKTLKAS